jgi:hypothetical protein
MTKRRPRKIVTVRHIKPYKRKRRPLRNGGFRGTNDVGATKGARGALRIASRQKTRRSRRRPGGRMRSTTEGWRRSGGVATPQPARATRGAEEHRAAGRGRDRKPRDAAG